MMVALNRMKTALGALCLIVAAAPAAGCQQADPQNRSDVVVVESDNTAMEAAKAKGRARLNEFFLHLARPAADERDFSVKFNLTEDRDAEFIWASDLRMGADGKLSGALANQPLDERFQMGQRVDIPLASVIDWSYFKNGVAQGHFTTRVMLSQLPDDQAAEIKAALGW